jgi:triacylglycerol esterase/lipase EstA (alpha/beta hydrolase family)
MPPLDRALRELVAAAPDGQVDVVAHSMGGIILRMVLARDPSLAMHVRRIVTLGSPHAGTAGARGLPLTTVKALGRRSPLLKELSTFPESARLTTIAARHDLVVYPQETAYLPGARVIELDGPGHTGLLTSRACITQVVEVVCAAESATG